MESKEVQEALKPILERIRKETYIPSAQAEQTDEKLLGVLIAKYFQWDGVAVLETAKTGLEESNFHKDAEAIESLIRFNTEENIPCVKCGDTETELHTNGRCGNCGQEEA